MTGDYHLHTPYCRHADGPLEAYAEQALARGLAEICFAPHVPLPEFPRGASDLRMEDADVEAYFGDVERLRRACSGITILAGLEADYYPGYEPYLGRLLESWPFDFVLMSVHFVREWPGENWLFRYDFPHKSRRQIYGEYFAAVKDGIRTGLYDCLAHLDLVKRPGAPVMATNAEDVEETLELAAARGMSLEVNCGGLRKPIGETYPSPGVLALATRKGLPLVMGSDAHEPAQVASGFAAAAEVLRAIQAAGGAGPRFVRYRARRLQPACLDSSTVPR